MRTDLPFKNRIAVEEINGDIREGMMLVNLAETWAFNDPHNKKKALAEARKALNSAWKLIVRTTNIASDDAIQITEDFRELKVKLDRHR